jgi:hypothetical protein
VRAAFSDHADLAGHGARDQHPPVALTGKAEA